MRLLYQRGEFGPDQTTVVAAALAAFSLGLTFNGFMLMLNRGVLLAAAAVDADARSRSATSCSTRSSTSRSTAWAPGGSRSRSPLANVAASGALLVLLRRRLGRIDFGAIASSFVRVTAASIVMAAVAYGVWRGLDEVARPRDVMQAISLLTALLAAAVVYLLAARALRIRELEALLALRRRRGAP